MSDAISRVHYFDQQFLRTQEFVDEQAYHVAMRRRHNIGQHSWGIVTGLELVVEEGVVYVNPGMGIDGYGRELVLSQRRTLPESAFADKGSDALEVWLEYDRVGSDPAPPGYTGCGDGEAPAYRWQEEPLVTLEVPDPAFTDRRRPQAVAAGDLDFPPYRTPPDDPLRLFPLFLGQIFAPAKPGQPPTVDLDGRPYVDLVGDSVRDPADRAWIQVGAQDREDPNAFAVYVRVTDPAASYDEPRLAILRNGEVEVEGDTTVDGNVTLRGSALVFGEGAERGVEDPPWRVYHVHDQTDQTHELRIEMGRPAAAGAKAGTNRVVVGSWAKPADGGQPAFQPCLTIADNGRVIVHGDLVVTGRIFPEAGEAAARLSERAEQFVESSFLSGVGGASGLLGRLYRSPFRPRRG
jgi:hypothetical protein